ncbi:hypothetical protein RHGRI_028931 [Rhododendron griersonianum]|uniref:Uncharacterized protein n=1 Tax=Rhododendron griersonianum TaxID=479676 RepID=A0AAV6INH7_9ERIC|nr:hypothetical protein RHGRI_028931 [Rhododendron griersonianum]
MPQVKIIAKNFMDMVASLPAMKLDKLYDNAFICEAILRSPFSLSLNVLNSKDLCHRWPRSTSCTCCTLMNQY